MVVTLDTQGREQQATLADLEPIALEATRSAAIVRLLQRAAPPGTQAPIEEAEQ